MDSNEKRLSIGEVSEITGVNTVTLRAWQRRYGLLKPMRTEKGHRLYGEDDVKRIEAILSWLDKGVPVSKVKELLDNTAVFPPRVEKLPEWDSLKGMMLTFDAAGAESTLLELTKNYPISVLENTLFSTLSDWFSEQNSEVTNLCRQLWLATVKNVLVRCLHLGSKAKGKKQCWLVGLHGDLDYRFYLQALMFQADGYNVTTYERIDTALPLLARSLSDSQVEKLVLYSDQALSAALKRDVVAVVYESGFDVRVEGACLAIHPDLNTTP